MRRRYMRMFKMPGSFPAEYQDDSSDSEASSMGSTGSVVVNGPVDTDNSSPRRRAESDEAVNALGKRLRDKLHVSNAKQKGVEDKVEHPQAQAPEAQPRPFKFRPSVGPFPTFRGQFAPQKESLAVARGSFTFGSRPPSDHPDTPQKPPLERVPKIEPLDFTAMFEQYRAANPPARSNDTKPAPLATPAPLPRGRGPANLFSAGITRVASSSLPFHPDAKALSNRSDSDNVEPSPKNQKVHWQPPDDRTAAGPSPAKRRFGYSEATNKSPITGPVADTPKEDSVRKVPRSQNASSDTIPNLQSATEFKSWAQKVLSFDEEDMDMYAEKLSDLYDFFVTFTDDLVYDAKAVHQHQHTISDLYKEFQELQAERYDIYRLPNSQAMRHDVDQRLRKVNDRRSLAAGQLALSKDVINISKNSFLERLVKFINTLLEYNSKKVKASSISAAELEAKNQRINDLRLAILGFEAELKVIRATQKIAEEVVEKLQVQLNADKLNATNDMKSLQVSHRDRLDQMLADHKADKREALSLQKEQYATQIENAETKLRLYKEATAQVEQLEENVKKLEQEKASVLLSKAALEKELDDLGAQARQGEMFEDAYKQIKAEFDQLQADVNDVVAERDDLRKLNEATQDAISSSKRASGVQVKLPTQTGTGALKSYDADLALLETFWKRQQNFAEMTQRQTQMEIDEVDEDIHEILRHLAVFETPEAPEQYDDPTESSDEDDPVPQPSVESSQPLQMMGTSSMPPRVEDYTTAGTLAPTQGTSRHARDSSIASSDSRLAYKKPSTWADKAAGRTLPAAAHKRNSSRVSLSTLLYHGDKVSTAEEASDK